MLSAVCMTEVIAALSRTAAAIDKGCSRRDAVWNCPGKSKVDVFFVHVQVPPACVYPDGRNGGITYAAKAGHSVRRSASC